LVGQLEAAARVVVVRAILNGERDLLAARGTQAANGLERTGNSERHQEARLVRARAPHVPSERLGRARSNVLLGSLVKARDEWE
jgi:hypothetical protein